MTTNSTDRRVVALVLLALGALVVLPVLLVGAGVMGFGPGGGMWGGGMGPGGTWGDAGAPGWVLVLGVVTRLLFLAVVVGVGYLLYRAVTTGRSGSDRALEELRVAYARGDVDDEEFERRRETLERER
jgi:putative membrane protein